MKPSDKYIFTLLDKKVHNRAAFLCGIETLDNYLHRAANQNAKLDLGRPFVMTQVGNDSQIIGYYSLSNYMIGITDLPERFKKGLPNKRPIGATLLGMMALDEAFQGKGLGTLLFFDALYRALRLNDQGSASFAVVIDALNEDAKAFYEHYDAVAFADNDAKLFITMKKIREIFTQVGLYPL